MSIDEIINDVRKSGEGARGMVFIENPITPENPKGYGHVVSIENTTNKAGISKIEIIDPSNSGMDASIFFESNPETSFYRFH